MVKFNAILLALLSVVCLVSAATSGFEKNGGVHYDKRGRLSIGATANMPVLVDAGWYSFSYGDVGSTAYRAFSVKNSQLVILHVQNCFCPGNTFSIYDNGEPILQSSLITASCDIPANNLVTIDTCYPATSLFGRGTAILLPGNHNLTIVVTASPYRGGTAFIRADSACTAPGVLPFPCIADTNWSMNIIA